MRRESAKCKKTAMQATPSPPSFEALLSEREDGENGPVRPIDYRTCATVWSNMATRDADLEVLCRAAALMGRICEREQAASADMSDDEA